MYLCLIPSWDDQTAALLLSEVKAVALTGSSLVSVWCRVTVFACLSIILHNCMGYSGLFCLYHGDTV